MAHHRPFNAGKKLLLIMAAAVPAVLAACAPGIVLHTRPERSGALPGGSYTLFLYGCGNPQDIENTVILAPERGRHSFSVHGPAFEYRVREGVPAEEALAEAGRFLRCSAYYRKARLRSVRDPVGDIIGYELRPLYSIVDFGVEDVLLVDYRQMPDGRVVVYVSLDPRIDRLINEERGPLLRGDGRGK